jgi:hypothetical protein
MNIENHLENLYTPKNDFQTIHPRTSHLAGGKRRRKQKKGI